MFKAEALKQLDFLYTSKLISSLNYEVTRRWINNYMKNEDNKENLLRHELLSIEPDGMLGMYVTLVAPHDKRVQFGYTIQGGKILWKDESPR